MKRGNEAWQLLPLYAAVPVLDETLSPTSCVRTQLMAAFWTKYDIKIFEYRIHWNINIRKNKFLYAKINGVNQKYNNTMPVMLCTGATFEKKNSCLVARIVSFDTAGLHQLTFRILEPYPSKYIDLDLSHVISH